MDPAFSALAPPARYGVAHIGADVSGIGTGGGDVTGLTVTFTVYSRPIVVRAKLSGVKQVTSTGVPQIYLASPDHLTIYDQWADLPSIATTVLKSNVELEAYFETPGTYTVVVYAITNAGTVTVTSSATGRSRLRWREE